MKSLFRSWLRLDDAGPEDSQDALRAVLDALERMEPDRARYLAQFAYLLGRVAHADQHVSPEETRAMEQLVQREGDLPVEQAMMVVALAQTSNRLFGGTENFTIAREFAASASYEQKFSLVRASSRCRPPPAISPLPKSVRFNESPGNCGSSTPTW